MNEYSQPSIGCFTQALWQVAGPLQLHTVLVVSILVLYASVHHLFSVFIENQTMSSAPGLAVQLYCLDNYACEHINILEYTEYFKAYTDLRNRE